MQGFEPFAMIVGSARRFAVDGDELVPVRPQRRNPAVETAAEQDRVDPVDEGAHPALAGDAVMEFRKAPQKGEMMFAPSDDVVEIASQEAIVAQVTSSRTSASGYITRQDSRS